MQHEFDEDDQLGLLSLAEDQDERQRLEDDLLALEQYRSEIVRVGGISRAQAQALIQDYGLQMGGEPLQSFTVLPSQTNCAVAMESIAGIVLEKLGDLIKRGWETFLKIIEWVVEKLSHLINGRKDQHERQRLIARFTASYRELWDLARKVDNAEGRELRDDVGSAWMAERRFAEHWTALAEQLAGQRLPGIYRSLSIDVLHLISVLELKVAAFEAAISKQPSPSADGDEIAATSQFRLIAEPIDPAHLKAHLGPLNLSVRPDATVQELLTAFADYNQELRRTPGDSHVDIEKLYDAVSRPDHPYNQPLMVAPENVKSAMEKLSAKVRNVITLNISDKMSHEHVTAFRKAQAVLQQELSGLQQYMTIVMFAENRRHAIHLHITDFGDSTVAMIRKLARGEGIPEGVRNRMSVLLQEYRAARDEYVRRYGAARTGKW